MRADFAEPACPKRLERKLRRLAANDGGHDGSDQRRRDDAGPESAGCVGVALNALAGVCLGAAVVAAGSLR